MNTIPQPNPDFYIAGGTLDPTASSYIVRQADKELLDAVKGGQFCYILTARQMGKSSLMVRTASSLQEYGILSVIIDLSDRATTNTNPEQWYLAQVRDIAEQLGLQENYVEWWQKQSQWGVVERFTQFLTQIVLKEISQPIVLFIDEIDSTLSLPFNCDDYFAMIRALYNKRAVDTALKRLTFVLLGVPSPSDLIKDTLRPPFNIGTRIQLTDFTIQEAQPLISGLAHDQNVAEKILENILFFTGGHPYLTQKTCLHVAKRARSQWNEAEAPLLVEKLIEEMFLSETGQKNDVQLQDTEHRILSSNTRKRLLQRYRLVRQKQEVRDNEFDPILTELKLSGLVKNDAGVLVVRNIIYERVFNEAWVERALAEDTWNKSEIFPSHTQSDDAEILEKLAENLDGYFHLLMNKYQDTIFKVAYSMLLRNPEDAEEVTMDTFVKVYQSLPKMIEKGQNIRFHHWLLTIVTNSCRNHRQYERKLPPPPFSVSLDQQNVRAHVEEMQYGQDYSAEDEAIQHEYNDELHLLLKSLPERQREIIILYYIGGSSDPEIASVLQLKPDTIKKARQRALKRLREMTTNKKISDQMTGTAYDGYFLKTNKEENSWNKKTMI